MLYKKRGGALVLGALALAREGALDLGGRALDLGGRALDLGGA